MSPFNRRDFLKMASLLPGAIALNSLAPKILLPGASQQTEKRNVIILLFDAMSATNLSLYGYARDTTPNFKRFAERANVYHAHNSAANFTTPGTASFLTGTYPWTHRAINIGGLISRDMVDHNLFHQFDPSYTRLAYSQNLLDNYFLAQFGSSIDTLLSPAAFSSYAISMGPYFQDPGAYRAYDDFMFANSGTPPSMILGALTKLFLRRNYIRGLQSHPEYPNGMPNMRTQQIYFELKKIFEGVLATLESLQAPYLTYLHFWAPHTPYRPTLPFMEKFQDNWKPIRKPTHPLTSKMAQSALNTRRANYDRYIADLDNEFGKLIDRFEQMGIFENSYVVVTSDHGELFERGESGHVTVLLSNPVVQIPLIISSPGQRSRVDIHTPTNSVDVLPTLLHLTGHPVPEWCEGTLLPGLGGKEDQQRSSFSIEAKFNSAFAPLSKASVAMRKGQHKLIYYKGYNNSDSFELYDTANDPEELQNLYGKISETTSLRDELLTHLDSSNQKSSK